MRVLQRVFGPRWVKRDIGPMSYTDARTKDLPKKEGWYRTMVSGDSESIDGHTIYEFGDYETWAYFTPHEDGGNFVGLHDEDNFTIFAYCGPFHIPMFK